MNLPSLGDVLNDRYRLEAILGDGGFGTVFRAMDLQTRTLVAVKVLHPDDGDRYLAATQRRFEREVAILSQLQSEHTVRLLSYGSTPSQLLYLVFEYLPGRDLSEVLRDGPLPPPIVEHILRQVLAALADAHRAGLTHRDIKPANIRVMQVGEDAYYTKLIDFGIARSVERDRVAVTKTGELIGTPRYMSPEQLRENELTAASDIYSLGVVAVEMLAGSRALLDSSLGAQLVRLQPEYQFPLPALGIPRLEIVLRKMTASPIERRFRTVGQVLDSLDGRQAAAPVEDVVRRLPAVLPIALLLLVVLLVLGGGFVFFKSDEPHEPPVRSRSLPIGLVKGGPDAAPTSVDVPPTTVDVGGDELPEYDPRACNKLPFRGMGRLEHGEESITSYLPTDLDRYDAVPLVFVLHGRYDIPGKDRMGDWLDDSGLAAQAEREGFVVLAPVDLEARFDDPWQEPEDVARLKRWLRVAADNLCIDETRVFVIGQNESSYLNHLLNCEDWVTATAFNSTRTRPDRISECRARPLPSIWITPRNTPRLPEQGGSECTELPVAPEIADLVKSFRRTAKPRGSAFSVQELMRKLTAAHTCTMPARPLFEEPGVGSCFEWTCDIPLRYCVHEGGEPWPGTSSMDPCAGEASDFPVGEQIWSFFASVPRLDRK